MVLFAVVILPGAGSRDPGGRSGLYGSWPPLRKRCADHPPDLWTQGALECMLGGQLRPLHAGRCVLARCC